MNNNYINYNIENYNRKYIIIFSISNILSFFSGFFISDKINSIQIKTNSTI